MTKKKIPLTPMAQISIASLAAGSPLNPDAHAFIPSIDAGNLEPYTHIISRFAPVLSRYGREWLLGLKPKDRICDSFLPLHELHTRCVTELIKESLLSRREWWCIQAFFTCMRHSHALDPSREAKLSLASHRANASSGHDSPLGVQKLVELHISRWLNTLTVARITGFAQLSRIFNFYLAGLLHRP
jgi:hypothetical protein